MKLFKCKLHLNLVLLCVSFTHPFSEAKSTLNDDQIKQQIIQESIASYSGNCPCPYNIARNGSQCGKRSAYSKPGGASPICYPEDVTRRMIEQFKRTQY